MMHKSYCQTSGHWDMLKYIYYNIARGSKRLMGYNYKYVNSLRHCPYYHQMYHNLKNIITYYI